MNTVLFNFIGFEITAYALGIFLATFFALLVFATMSKGFGLQADTWTYFGIFAIILGLLFARLFYFLARLEFYIYDIGLYVVFNIGGGAYALWGAIAGLVISAIITAKITKQSILSLLDISAVSGALALSIGRFAEFFTTDGIGSYVENPMFMKFPFAVVNEYGEWYWSIFIAEAIAALIIFFILISKKRAAGNTGKLFILLFCSSQILWESLRRDSFLRWLFVRVSQLTALLVLLSMMIWASIYIYKHYRDIKRIVIAWIAMVLSSFSIVLMEFAIDKSDIANWIIYSLMALACVVIGISSYSLIFYREKK